MNQIETKKQRIEYFSHVIGLISLMVLGKLIGNNGLAYMALIIECISLFVLLINGVNGDLIGRLIRSRRKKNQYREANQLHKSYILVQCILTFVMMAAYFFLADVLTGSVFQLPFLNVAVKILTPVILFRVLQSLMLGYFQGMGAHMPTAVSAVFRQLLFLLFALLFTDKLTEYGQKVAVLLNNPDLTGMYGALGVCLAIVVSEILVTLFLVIIYVGSDRKKELQKAEEGLQRTESSSDRLRLIVLVSIPEMLKELMKKLPFGVCLIYVLRNAQDLSRAAEEYGVFYGYFMGACAIGVFLILLRVINITNSLAGFKARKDNRSLREYIYAGLHYCWVYGLYMSVSMAVLAPQFSVVIHKQKAEVLEQYYVQGAAIITLLVVGIFIWRALYTTGAQRISYFLLGILNVAFVLANVLLRSKNVETIPSILYSSMIALAVYVILAFILMVRRYVLQPDMIRGCLIPIIAAGAMGLVMMLIQRLLSPHVSDLMCLLLCLAFGVIAYSSILFATRSIKENEVNYVYGKIGRRILGIFIR